MIIAGVTGAIIPQTNASDQVEGILAASGLDHVFTSWWFAALLIPILLSLIVVVLDQFRQFRKRWSRRLDEKHFANAPYRLTFERELRADASAGSAIRRYRRAGLLGSPLFHSGLLLVVVAGCLRAAFGVEAVVDLVEGEVLAADHENWVRQWPGVFAAPMHLDDPLTLNRVEISRYEGGR